MTEEEYNKVMIPWRKELQQIFEEKIFTPSTLYNADQTGLFYQKLPNSLYIKKGGKSGIKAMKDKTRVTVMV